MRTSTWTGLAAGAILIFAVGGQFAFIDLRMAGLILIARALAGTWFSAGRAGRARTLTGLYDAAARGAQGIGELTADPRSGDRRRVPLIELLAGSVTRQPAGNGSR